MILNFSLNIRYMEPLTQLKTVLEMSGVPLKVKRLPDNHYTLVSGTSFLRLDMEPATGPDYGCSGTLHASEEVAIKAIKTLSLALHADGIEHRIQLMNESGEVIFSFE